LGPKEYEAIQSIFLHRVIAPGATQTLAATLKEWATWPFIKGIDELKFDVSLQLHGLLNDQAAMTEMEQEMETEIQKITVATTVMSES
jgi:hypothetical protein